MANVFFHLGHCGLGALQDDGSYKIEEWFNVENNLVIAYDKDNQQGQIDHVDAIIGCVDIIDALKTSEINCLHDEDYDYEDDERSWDDSVNDIIRQMVGNAVAPDFDLYAIKQHMSDTYSRIVSVVYHYQNSGKDSPTAITATNEAGEEKRLDIVA